MFDWLGDIIGGIGNFFGDTFGWLGDQVSSAIWDTMLRWFYTAIYDAIAQFFTQMGNLGVEMYDLEWIKAALHLFYLFGWALFVTGMVVAIFDIAIESQSGRVNIKNAVINIFKGFMAASLVTVVPLELYKFCITLQNTFAGDLTRVFAGQQSLGLSQTSMSVLESSFAVGTQINVSVFNILAMIAMAYCVIKIFFANIKRGGILFIQMAVGTLYLFSVPRGYNEGFTQWCKQIVALCLTAFLQTTLLFMGLITFSQNMLLGLGIMLSAAEVPRIAGQFGLDTTMRFNMMSAVHATTTAVNLTRSATKAVVK
ncbi:MAG TPA: DUF6045 family protein [Bacillota bacterium]|jgi:hypothetical protein|nr:DUF6045 family protein [Bacillota bacterium]